MLVYLDTSHLALLERSDAVMLREFFDTWQHLGCELALSLHHLQEIGQLANSVSIRKRAGYLQSFPSIRCRPAGSVSVLEMEVEIQVLNLLGVSVDVARSAAETLFPLATAGQILEGVLTAEPLLKSTREALEFGATASNSSKAGITRVPPLPDREFFSTTEDAIRAFLTASPDLNERAQRLMVELTHNLGDAVKESGVRPALVRLYGLDNLNSVDSIPNSDLGGAMLFVSTAKEGVDRICALTGLPRSSVFDVLRLLNPYQAPGYSLKLAVARARRTHPSQDVAGDQLDEDHVAFAPYVDLLFVDKRTHAFLKQEKRDRPALVSSFVGTNVRRAATLADVSAAISRDAAQLEG